MKDKFKEAILANYKYVKGKDVILINEKESTKLIANACNTLYQQAMKEEREKMLKEIRAKIWQTRIIEDNITDNREHIYNQGVEKALEAVRKIAKENNIEL